MIVEGHSDLFFYAAFLHHMGRLPGVYIQEFQGKSKILNRELLGDFITPKLLAEKSSIGILLDADENAAGTVQSIRSHLKALTGRDVPEGQWHDATGEARLGFFVAPEPTLTGEIETLAWNAFQADDKHTQMKRAVAEYLEKMAELGWKVHSRDKGRIGAFLSAAYDEDPRLGAGAREGRFDFDLPGFDRLRTFLSILPVHSTK